VKRVKRETMLTLPIHLAKYVHLDPPDPLVIKVLLEHQVHLENVVILVSQERRETKESLVPPGNEDPLVHLAKTVRTNNFICIYLKKSLCMCVTTTSHIISIQQEPRVIRETRVTMDVLETREIRERREIRETRETREIEDYQVPLDFQERMEKMERRETRETKESVATQGNQV
jgi:hypothetical protein